VGAPQSSDVAGFWSYTHADNKSEGGRVLDLAEDLKSAFGLLTGEELTLFTDRDIAWGEQWRKRIDEALAGTTFLIPVVTPRFFGSEECRGEVLRFMREAKAAGVPELLMPIFYAHVPELAETGRESSDEVVRMVAEANWIDWRQMRLEDIGSSAFRKGVHEMAERLVEISEQVADRPSLPEPRSEVAAPPGEGDDSDSPGFMEIVAEAEAAFPAWVKTMEGLTSTLNEIGTLTDTFAEEMQQVDPRKGMAGRLQVTRRFAASLMDPAERAKELGQDFASQVVRIDPAVESIVAVAEADPEEIERQQATEFIKSVSELANTTTEASIGLRELIRALDQNSSMSREMRKPIRVLKTGLNAVLDAQGVVTGWEETARRLEDIPAIDPEAKPKKGSEGSTDK
jgi:hypothetical protein